MSSRQFAFALTWLLGFGHVGMVGAEPVVCREFRALGWPGGEKLYRFALTSTLARGQKEEAVDYFYNLDIDGDDIEDVISLSCSASRQRADPCMLGSKLSSGRVIEFEAWYLYLIRHHGLVYAVTANEVGADHKIYRVGPSNVELVCPVS